MPYPIWSHAADCVMELIQRNTILTPEQERDIHAYVRRIPVRCIVDLLMTLSNHDYTMTDAIFADDALELENAFDGTTAHADHHMVILNTFRTILGQDPWFPTDSAVCEYATRYFQHTQDTEEHVGFDPSTLTTLYAMLTDFSDSDDDSDDNSTLDADGANDPILEGAITLDDSDTASIQTESTIPLENDLGEFLENYTASASPDGECDGDFLLIGPS